MNGLIGALLAASPSVDPSFLGYTGLLNVPTAEVQTEIVLAFRWEDAERPHLLAGVDSPINRSYIICLPFLPFTEASLGFLQVIGWPDPTIPVFTYGTHRTSGAKVQLPIPWKGPKIALGAVDPVSANLLYAGPALESNYGLTTFYAVATQALGPLSATFGWGTGDRRRGSAYRPEPFLDGPFGGLALGIPGGFTLMSEWDALDLNFGARWRSPWGLSLSAGRLGGGWVFGLSLASAL